MHTSLTDSVKKRSLINPVAEVHRRVTVDIPGAELRPGLGEDGGQPLPEPPGPGHGRQVQHCAPAGVRKVQAGVALHPG